jgi:futalosine hydrolase
LVAQRFRIKAFQIRAISNYCGNRDKQSWKPKKAFIALAEFLEYFNK